MKNLKSSNLQGDLDNIILMALRKEPNRRYASVEEFSNDISCYLNNLPVSARPNTLFYRASKFYYRNKTASIIGVLFALSLIVGIFATTWLAIVALQERDRAEKRFQDVRKLSNSLLFEITPKIERIEGSTKARELLVIRALEYLDSLSSESQNDLGLQSELASAYEKVGDVQGNPGKANLGDLQGGIKSYQKAQAIRLSLLEKKPDDFETQRLLAANYNSINDFHWWASDVEGALDDCSKAIEIYEKLVTQQPENLTIQLEFLNTILNKIRIVSYNGSYDESINEYKSVLERVEKLEVLFPQDVELKRIKAHSFIRIAYNFSWQEKLKEADEAVKKSMAIYEPLATANPNDGKLQRDLYLAYFLAGGIYFEPNPKLAREFLNKSVAAAQKNLSKDDFNYQAKYDLAQSYSKLGELSAFEKKSAEAVEFLSKAQLRLNELVAAEPNHLGYKFSFANNYARLASALETKGDYANAIENYEKAIAKHFELSQSDPNDSMSVRAIAIAEQDCGRVYQKLKMPEKSVTAYQKSVEWFNLLEQKGGMSEYDKKNFLISRKAVEELKK